TGIMMQIWSWLALAPFGLRAPVTASRFASLRKLGTVLLMRRSNSFNSLDSVPAVKKYVCIRPGFASWAPRREVLARYGCGHARCANIAKPQKPAQEKNRKRMIL